MQSITLLDTAVGSTNRGDEIIMKCVEEEMQYLLSNYYTLKAPTHLRSFGIEECFYRMPDSASEIASSKYKFVCGTNLLAENMRNRTNQWNINLWNCRPIQGCVLIGVGGSGKIQNRYTKKLYTKVLSKNYFHSVRNQGAYDMLQSLGIPCLNTGCVTLWKLTPEFCTSIRRSKGEKAVFTLTDYSPNPCADKQMVETILNSYNDVSFWIQGMHDLEYLHSLKVDISRIHIISSTVQEYENALRPDVDYIGTRLHAGIFAIRNHARAIILTLDQRMNSMRGCIPNNCIDRGNIDMLKSYIYSEIKTESVLNWDAIDRWKGQFK